MVDTPTTGETIIPATPSNEPSTSGTPAVTPPVKTDDGEVERLRKELAQKELRERQLANELDAERKAKADREAKELSDNQQYKELAEQEKAKREALEADVAERERKAEIRKAKNEVLADYDDNLKEAATEFGIDLTDDSEEAKADFKDKLEKLNTRIANTSKVTPNNPGAAPSTATLTGDQLREVLSDDDKFVQYVSDPKRYPVLSQMTTKRK